MKLKTTNARSKNKLEKPTKITSIFCKNNRATSPQLESFIIKTLTDPPNFSLKSVSLSSQAKISVKMPESSWIKVINTVLSEEMELAKLNWWALWLVVTSKVCPNICRSFWWNKKLRELISLFSRALWKQTLNVLNSWMKKNNSKTRKTKATDLGISWKDLRKSMLFLLQLGQLKFYMVWDLPMRCKTLLPRVYREAGEWESL